MKPPKNLILPELAICMKTNLSQFLNILNDSSVPHYLVGQEEIDSFIVVKRSRPVFRIEPVEEKWETIADFSSLPGGGISAKKLLAALRKA